jgi:protein-tyrosine phosphatase
MGGVKASVGIAAPKREAKQRPLENILNFRDVGKTINDFLGEKNVSSHMESKLNVANRLTDA